MKNLLTRLYFFFFETLYKFTEKNLLYFENNNFNRISLINFGILKFGSDCKYLEIGVFQDIVFNSIPLPLDKKIGVDPVQGGTHRMTSDVFFKDNNSKFDIIFIDGLHTYDQVKKDFINSYNSLSNEGIIYLHDVLPVKSIYQTKIRKTSIWNGDVWKLAYQLASHEPFKKNFVIANIDFGVGIFKKKSTFDNLDFLKVNFSSLDHNNLKSFAEKLPIKNVFDSINFISND